MFIAHVRTSALRRSRRRSRRRRRQRVGARSAADALSVTNFPLLLKWLA